MPELPEVCPRCASYIFDANRGTDGLCFMCSEPGTVYDYPCAPGETCSHCGEPATHLYDISGGGFKPHQPVCDSCDPEEPRSWPGSDAEPSDPWDSQTNRDIAEHYRRNP